MKDVETVSRFFVCKILRSSSSTVLLGKQMNINISLVIAACEFLDAKMTTIIYQLGLLDYHYLQGYIRQQMEKVYSE
jgi:hypothetical protein